MAVDWIEKEKRLLYLVADGQHVSIIVTTSDDGHKYLKAETDFEEPSLLFNLPECPFLTQ
jgi:hypothetical protein